MSLPGVPGVQGHTDTETLGAGRGERLSKGHQPPWNRKGWFRSNRHLSWRQSPGRLTGRLTLLGTSARDSTTSNSMKGACRKPGGSLPMRPRVRPPLPSAAPLPGGARALSTAGQGAEPHFTDSYLGSTDYVPGLGLGAVSPGGEETGQVPGSHEAHIPGGEGWYHRQAEQ